MKRILIILCLLMFLWGCSGRTGTIPSHINVSEGFDLLKVNPDKVRNTFQPIMDGNIIIYGSAGDGRLYMYDAHSAKTKRLKIYARTFDYDNNKLVYVDMDKALTGDIVLQDLSSGTRAIVGYGRRPMFSQGLLFWHQWGDGLEGIARYDPETDRKTLIADFVGTPNGRGFMVYRNEVILRLLDVESSEEILLSTDFLQGSVYAIDNYHVAWSEWSGEGGDGLYLYDLDSGILSEIEIEVGHIAELALSSDYLFYRTSSCIYAHPLSGGASGLVVCDENFVKDMSAHGSNVLFVSNDRNAVLGGRVSNDVFMVRV